jgi:hypothetical protein
MAHRKNKYSKLQLEEVAKKMEGKAPDRVEHERFDGNTSTTIHRTLKIRTYGILIGIPMDELMFSQFLSNFMGLSIMPWDSTITTQDTFVNEARNVIHNKFLESEYPFLFMLDSDVLPPPDTIERLLEHDLPVVGGFYRKKEKFKVKKTDGSIEILQRPVVYDYSRFDEETQKHKFSERIAVGTGLEKVDGIGAGCLLIRRDAAEKVGKSPYSLLFGGEDLTFCRTLHDADIPIHVDWTISAGHVGTFNV